MAWKNKKIEKQYRKQYNLNHKEESKQYYIIYSKKNKDKIAQRGVEYRKNNKDKISTLGSEYYKKNKDKINKKSKAWHEKNKEYVAQRIAKYRKELREKMFEILGHKCIKCNFIDKRALQFDHINSDGNVERENLSGTQFQLYYILHPEEAKNRLQVLCANCNWIKIEENHERYNSVKLKPNLEVI